MTTEIYFDNVTEKWILAIKLDITPILVMFDTAEEAWNMSNKLTFVQSLITMVTELAKVSDTVPDLAQVYLDRGYNSGGSDPIIDDDVVEIGMTAADIAEIITLLNNFEKFTEGETIVEAIYRITMNKFRDDT